MEQDKSKFQKELLEKLNLSSVAPFLFIGSGISRRYVNTPTWDSLLEDFVNQFPACFKNQYGYYSSLANRDLAKIATNLANDFHQFWWNDEQFEESRNQYKFIASMDTEKPFKIELCKLLQQRVSQNNELSEEINLFSTAIISGIVTTNWDTFLEGVFKEFVPKIGQKEIIFNEQKKLGEIFKIHGCITRPETLVATDSDYNFFIDKSHYLNSKLLTLLVDFPIVFMGYSLSDKNIEKIISNLVECLRQDLIQEDKLKDRLFFVDWKPNECVPSIIQSTYQLNSVSIPIQKIELHDYADLLEVLSKLERKFPITILRQLESMVYDFVMTSEPTNKILVTGMENLDQIENLEVVLGFGNISKLQDKGVVGLKVIDLIEDIIFDNLPRENYQDIVEKLLPTVVTKSNYVPFFKYHKATSNLNDDNSLKGFVGKSFTLSKSQSISIDDYRLKNQKTTISKQIKGINSLDELLVGIEFNHAIQRIPYLSKEKIETDLLRQFLKDNWELHLSSPLVSSNFRKCVCLLDYLENANH